MLWAVAATFLALGWSFEPAQAENSRIEVLPCEKFEVCGQYRAWISIRGIIRTGDKDRIESAFYAAGAPLGMVGVMLDSRGGSFAESLEIGRWVRSRGYVTAVMQSGTCASACVFILAGGIHRFAAPGQVLIHRPYLTDRGMAAIGTTMRSMIAMLREYLADMGMHPDLAEDMIAVEPRDVRTLMMSDLQRYRLIGIDAVWAERRALERMDMLGISRDELMERERRLAQSGEFERCEALPVSKRVRCHIEVTARFGLSILNQTKQPPR